MDKENISLFSGLARPSYFFGIVQEAFIVELFSTVLLFTATGNMLMFLFIIPFHITNMVICSIDNRAYLHLKLFAKTKMQNRNFQKLGVSIY